MPLLSVFPRSIFRVPNYTTSIPFLYYLIFFFFKEINISIFMRNFLLYQPVLMQRSEKDAVGLLTHFTGQGCPTANGTPACTFPSVASPMPACLSPPHRRFTFSAVFLSFPFYLKAKPKSPNFKRLGLNPFYSALCTDGSDVCIVF